MLRFFGARSVGLETEEGPPFLKYWNAIGDPRSGETRSSQWLLMAKKNRSADPGVPEVASTLGRETEEVVLCTPEGEHAIGESEAKSDLQSQNSHRGQRGVER